MTSQAIEAAIELNLKTVEAGAQGEHKIERGYLPVTTYSCHYLIDEDFRKAIEDFLVRESSQVWCSGDLYFVPCLLKFTYDITCKSFYQIEAILVNHFIIF